MIRFLSLSLLILLFPPRLAAQSLADTAPRIISSPTLEAVAGQAYTYQIQCTGDPAPTYRLAKGPGTMVLDAGRGRLIHPRTNLVDQVLKQPRALRGRGELSAHRH